MPDGEGLGQERPIRVAVEVDLRHAERVQDGGDVVGRRAGAVQVRRRAELATARAAGLDVVAAVVLEPRAVDQRRAPDAADVDEEQVAPAEQRSVRRQPQRAARRRRVAGTSLHGHDRADARPGAVASPVQLEADRDLAERRIAAIERHPDGAAQCAGPIGGVGARLEAHRGRRRSGGREHRDQDREAQEAAHAADPTSRLAALPGAAVTRTAVPRARPGVMPAGPAGSPRGCRR